MAATITMISVKGFESAVLDAFRPLQSGFGFEHDGGGDFSCRFVKAPVSIEARYQPNTHELNLWVADDVTREPPLELSDVLRATDCPSEPIGRVELMQTGDAEVLKRLMSAAVEYLVRHAGAFLQGDPRAFGAAREILLARSTEYTNQVLIRSAIASADRAWRSKDFATVDRELSPHTDSLDRHLRRRLEYARKQLRRESSEIAEE